jgi:D-beta-D-heptose 7-phosphate kinase/D-beta-D-heptose 1-phosphate adenosyltransferase
VIGFTNGCYDILHVGHLYLFQKLREKCDYVIIGIDSDYRVKHLKGPQRPINKQEDRKLMLESLIFIDEVRIFDSEESLTDLVKQISPDLMIVGADYRDKRVIGAEYAKRLEFFEKIDGYSTTKIIQSFTNR